MMVTCWSCGCSFDDALPDVLSVDPGVCERCRDDDEYEESAYRYDDEDDDFDGMPSAAEYEARRRG